MKSKYQIETDNFIQNFQGFKDARMAIYGIGRRTATLLPGLGGFRIVGLLDRDRSNVGKEIQGMRVISLEEAEETADLIVINSDPTNFQTIYRRIASTHLPVYYANGAKAELPDEDYRDDPCWDRTREELKAEIDAHDVISFDFFDTLAMRKVLQPTDVFRLLEKAAGDRGLPAENLAWRRQEAAGMAQMQEPRLEDIYRCMEARHSLSHETAIAWMDLELEIEKKICVKREPVVRLLRYAMQRGKTVHIVSDTYFSMKQMEVFLRVCGLEDFPAERVWLSSERKAAKSDGSLWEIYAKAQQGRKCLHIGDNEQSDGRMPKRYGIDGCCILSGKDMMARSSIAALLPKTRTLADSIHLGLVACRLFQDPFALGKTRGKIAFSHAEDFGYAVFGGVMTRFLCWLRQAAREKQYDRLLFFSRDGYFLLDDFRHLLDLASEESIQAELRYLPVSRRLLYMATMETEEDLAKAIHFPYVGKFSDYLRSRFNLEPSKTRREEGCKEINAAASTDGFRAMMEPYMDGIREEAGKERAWYLSYLQREGLLPVKGKTATVDFSYYGTNQYYFQRLTGKRVDGYYFSACHSDRNEYRKTCKLFSCFNDASDPEAQGSDVKKKSAFLESFLTAPYGMIRYIDRDGKWVCEPDKTNQRNFGVKEAANQGIKEYLQDFVGIYGFLSGDGVNSLEAFSYYTFLDGSSEVSKDVLQGFFYDNDMVGSKEMPLEA